MTLRSGDFYKRYGDPRLENNMSLWYCPPDLLAANPKLPRRIYANNDIHRALTAALYNCYQRGVLHEIKTFGGCFIIRNIRGSGQMSVHSWGAAVDFNPSQNPLGKTAAQCLAAGLMPFTERFLQCWRETGWECGGDWKSRPDRQHFQIARLP